VGGAIFSVLDVTHAAPSCHTPRVDHTLRVLQMLSMWLRVLKDGLMIQGKSVPTFKAHLENLEPISLWNKDIFGLINGARCWFIETILLGIQTAARLQRNEAATVEEKSPEKRTVLEKARLLLKLRVVHLLCNLVLAMTWSRASSFLSRRWCGIFALATSIANLSEQYLAIEG